MPSQLEKKVEYLKIGRGGGVGCGWWQWQWQLENGGWKACTPKDMYADIQEDVLYIDKVLNEI